MIISPEVFYNIAAMLHIAMLVLVVVFIIGQVTIFVAKYRAVKHPKRKFERDIEGMTGMIENLPEMLKGLEDHIEKQGMKPIVVTKTRRPAVKKVAKKVIKKKNK